MLQTYMDDRSLQILRRTYLCGLSYRAQRHIVLLQDLEGLSAIQKTRIINRYIEITEELHKRKIMYAIIFHSGRLIVSIGSLIVPALLSIQYTNTPTSNTNEFESFSYNIYWATWVISLLVTIFNGILTLFKIDKKYYFLHTTVEQFQSEVWQYIHLTGKYAGYYTKGKPATHSTQYIFFCHAIERIKLKQVEEEYFKLSDSPAKDKYLQTDLSGNTTAAVAGTKDPKTIAGIFAPTPDQEMLFRQQGRFSETTFRSVETLPKPTLENTLVIIDGSPSNKETATEDQKETERREVSPRAQDTMPV